MRGDGESMRRIRFVKASDISPVKNAVVLARRFAP